MSSCCSEKETNPEESSKENCCDTSPSSVNSCCESSVNTDEATGCCDNEPNKIDWLLWGSLSAVLLLYAAHFYFVRFMNTGEQAQYVWLSTMTESVFELLNTMWWGIVIGIIMVAVIGRVPRELVMSVLGTKTGVGGIFRATAAGVLLDLCSHGILMVGAKLYERGASSGQVIAFLVASPWNSFSLTLILFALIGFYWTLAFIALSMIIAIIAGILFDHFVSKGVLPNNKNQIDLPKDFKFLESAKQSFYRTKFSGEWFLETAWEGLKGSRMVLRWILFGVLLASAVRTFVSVDVFSDYFGPTLLGLALTMIAATIIEVCSEGSTPIAADLVTRANSPGNGFAFLMTGVATDYTEIMVLKDTTRSWKFALFLPLTTLPQVLVVAYFLNTFSH
ncbi:MAG: permease [Cellvibrionaceae bacterium]